MKAASLTTRAQYEHRIEHLERQVADLTAAAASARGEAERATRSARAAWQYARELSLHRAPVPITAPTMGQGTMVSEAGRRRALTRRRP